MPSFLALSVVWGSSFALIKVTLDGGLAPVWVAFGRCFFGALTLATICLVRRESLPRCRATWGHALAVAALLNSVPFSLLAFGETHVSSVLAGIFNAITPLTTLLFVLLLVPQEQLTARRLSGLMVGFCGVLIVLGIWEGIGGASLIGSLACIGSTVCMGAGFAYTRRHFSDREGSAVALSTTQLVCATAQLAVLAPLFNGAPDTLSAKPFTALVVLGALGTGVAYILNLGVIRVAGPTIASTVTYVIPIWSTLFGTVLLSEPLSWNTAAGAVLVVAGVVLTRAPKGPAKSEPAAVSPDPEPEPRRH
ncbi:DMT family transporter [Streptomyces sp. NPDC048057]|uniref:DMT family transporter n=1 Tax=Streptomyces sp. NPDC048057 TaxID=3155628 RepID=UPI0034119A54